MKSLKELLEYASRFGVRLGLENRYHYFDIPTQDEMAALLTLPNQTGSVLSMMLAMPRRWTGWAFFRMKCG